MIHRINRKKYQIYGFDIESHNDDESIQKQETSMWLGCLLDENSKEDDESCYFYNMDSFIDKLEELSSRKRGKHNGINDSRPCNNICIYIYNLSFEWSFILPVLIQRGFKFKEFIEKGDSYCFNSVSTKTASSVWMANVKFGEKSGNILFRDLAKLYGGGLGKVAKAFNLEVQKGEIDYTLNRLHNHVVTKEEKHYCFKDVKILVEILQIMIEKNDKDFWNSCSMASYSMRKLLKSAYPNELKPYKKFREEYPQLGNEESEFLRHSVSGGITYATSKWQFVDIHQDVVHIDAHQMHPTQMATKPFPCGEGTYFTGEPPLRFKTISCCHIRITYDAVKIHSVISLIGLSMITDKELWLWDFEIPVLKKCYINLQIEYIDGYYYLSRFLPFRKYVINNYKERLKAKAIKDEFNTLYYKLLNNSSYGKFLEKPHNEVIENIINPLGIIDSKVTEKPLEDVSINAKYTYLPVGSCIPAYSRVNLIEMALKIGWEKVTYFDTDSIFFIKDDASWKIWENDFNHNDFLGGWGLEEICNKAQFTASKRYKTESNGEAVIKAGGINFKAYIEEKINKYIKDNNLTVNEEEKKDMIEGYRVDYNEINIISSSWQVQRAYRVKGGTLIQFQEKKMDVANKYIEIYKNNVLK